MHYKELCGKPYLGAEDLPEDKDIPLIIEAVFKEMAFNPGSKKEVEVGVLKFKDKSLKMILNITNSKAIAAVYGTETNKWIGQTIKLYRTTTRLGNKTVACLRIKV